MKQTVLLLLLAYQLSASDLSLWQWSLASVASSNAADTISSIRLQGTPGLYESGWLYHGKFGGEAVGIKAAFVGGQALVQWLIVRKHPRAAKWFTVFNFSESVPPAVSAVSNWQKR